MDEIELIARFNKLYHEVGFKGRTWSNTWWMGVPVWKCPLDLWNYQEILVATKPDLIIETGTWAGGSALYLAHLCDILGTGRVITIDIAQDPSKMGPSRIEVPFQVPTKRPVHPRIQYVTGSSVDPVVVDAVKGLADGSRTMVILDSDHSTSHVLKEISAYSPLVSEGCYLVVEDGNHDASYAGPAQAIDQFMAETKDFQIDRSREKFLLTFNPNGFLLRRPR